MKTYLISLFIMALPVWLPLVISVPLGVVLFPALALSTYLFAREAGK
jgi:hypothetical protein